MYSIIEAVIEIVLFSFGFYGLWLLIGSPFVQTELESSFRNWKRKRKIKRLYELNHAQKKEKKKNLFNEHLQLLLSVVLKKDNVSPLNFLFLTSLIFFISDIVLITLLNDFVFSTVISVGFSIVPYMILRYRLITLRLRTQFAFINEFHNVIQNYQSTGKDIYYTIQNVVKESKDKELKRVYIKLFSSLQKDRGHNDFAKAIMIFSYSINSTHAKRFAKLLMKGHIDRADISLSLIDLNKNIKKRQQDIQKEKTQKLETVLLGYLPIILFPLLIFMAYRVAGVRDFWFFFQQRITIYVFVLALICSIASVLTAYLTSKPRADI